MHNNSLLKFEITRFDRLIVRNHSTNGPDVYFKVSIYSQTYIKGSHLRQRKSGLIRQLTS